MSPRRTFGEIDTYSVGTNWKIKWHVIDGFGLNITQTLCSRWNLEQLNVCVVRLLSMSAANTERFRRNARTTSPAVNCSIFFIETSKNPIFNSLNTVYEIHKHNSRYIYMYLLLIMIVVVRCPYLYYLRENRNRVRQETNVYDSRGVLRLLSMKYFTWHFYFEILKNKFSS